MASRLHLKYGLVAEQDRLDSSADSLLVVEPTTGSKSRSKGNLYIVVTARAGIGGRPHEATALVADTIRREYYYDESAGIPICLHKAIRAANRKLRSAREGRYLPPHAVGVGVAVVRAAELYVATLGDAEAYLVRQARLFTPEHEATEGLPSNDDVQVDVWRGDLSVGDSLVIVSRDLTEAVGPEELKSALVTLHPQSAAEHLHHLFVANGGDGSDAVLALEASEATAVREGRGLVAVSREETPDGDAPRASVLVSTAASRGGAGARGTGDGGARRASAVASASGSRSLLGRISDLLPRRAAHYRRLTPQVSRRESQRRAAFAVLALLGIMVVLGVGVTALGGVLPGHDENIPRVRDGEAAVAAAQDRIDQVFGAGNLVKTDSARSVRLLREAWQQLGDAEAAGVPKTRTDPLRARVSDGLDALPPYNVRHNSADVVYSFDQGAQVHDLVQGPDGAAYVIDDTTRSVLRVDLASRQSVPVVRVGQGPGDGIGRPRLLVPSGPDLLIVDIRDALWRWRPSGAAGEGTLGQIRLGGDTTWGADVQEIGTFPVNADAGLYRLYVVDPSSNQILRYQPTADGSSYLPPTKYLATDTEAVASFKQIHIDGNVYALTADGVIQHVSGRQQGFKLATLPDEGDLRPGHEFGLFAGTGGQSGRLYLWDARYARIVAYSKTDGAFLEQFIARPPTPPFSDLKGMFVIESPAGGGPDTLVWLAGNRVLSSPLRDATGGGDAPSGSPAPTLPLVSPPAASPAGSPGRSPSARPTRTRRP